MEWEIKALVTGSNWSKFVAVGAAPATFPSKSAALAWLIDYAKSFGADVIQETDIDHPDCIDVLVCKETGADQFVIEPVGFKLNN